MLAHCPTQIFLSPELPFAVGKAYQYQALRPGNLCSLCTRQRLHKSPERLPDLPQSHSHLSQRLVQDPGPITTHPSGYTTPGMTPSSYFPYSHTKPSPHQESKPLIRHQAGFGLGFFTYLGRWKRAFPTPFPHLLPGTSPAHPTPFPTTGTTTLCGLRT